MMADENNTNEEVVTEGVDGVGVGLGADLLDQVLKAQK